MGSRATVVCALALAAMTLSAQQPPPSALRIVVINGEGAVNVVSTKTAVAPIVEVRDRNNQPVAGVAVRFAIAQGRATINGVRIASIVTDAAGRAAMSGLTPTGAGALQISATAAFQGETAAVTIVQTNVMTAAQAAAVTSSAAGGALSTTAVGVIGGAAAGAVVAVKQLQHRTGYAGSFSGAYTLRFNPTGTCTVDSTISGSVELFLDLSDDGSVTGIADSKGGEWIDVATNCPGTVSLGSATAFGWSGDVPVAGAAGGFSFHAQRETFPGPPNALDAHWDFAGSLNGDTVTGTMTYSLIDRPRGFTQGTVTMPLVLTKMH